MTRQFMQLAMDRYPSSDKALQCANAVIARANIQDPVKLVKARIMVLSRMRDAVRQVSGTRIFTSIQHRDDCYNAIIEALEDLENELEELEVGEAEEEWIEEEEEES